MLISPRDSPAEGTEAMSVIERAGEAEALSVAKEFARANQIYTELTN